MESAQPYNGIRARTRIVGVFKAEFLSPDPGSNDFSAREEAVAGGSICLRIEFILSTRQKRK